MEVKYSSVTNLTKTFDIGRMLATSLVNQMQCDPDFKEGVISISHKKKLVNIELFEAFLKEKLTIRGFLKKIKFYCTEHIIHR